MTTPAQFLFKKIVLHNKLMDEAEIDLLLTEVPEPEQAIQRMIKEKVLPIQKANPLLDMYYGQLKKLSEEGHDMTAPTKGIEGQESEEKRASFAANDEELKKMPHVDSPVQRAQLEDIEALQAPDSLHPMVARLLKLGRKIGASEVHMRASEVPLFRCAGQLHAIEGEMPVAADACERGVLSVLGVDQCEDFLKKGDMELCYDGGRTFGRYRISVMRRQGGVHGAFHPIPLRILTFEQLRLPSNIEQFAERKDGLVLITGPRGAGKTATLAALIDRINETQARNIISVENPIEFVHLCKKSHVIQREIGTHAKSFVTGVQTALRKAVSVIAIDEMCDLATIRLALTATETEHLVFAVVSAPKAECAIEWLIDRFPPKERESIRVRIADVLEGIVSQRLVPGSGGDTIEPVVEIFDDPTAMAKLIREGKTDQLPNALTSSPAASKE